MVDTETSDRDLLARIGRVTIAAWGEYATRSGGRLVVDDGLTYVVGSHPTPAIINTVFRTDPRVIPADVLARTREFYSALGHGFTLVTSDHSDADLIQAADAGGWTMAIKLPAMVCRAPLAGSPMPAGVSLRRAEPRADIDAFRAVIRGGFANDEDEIAAVETAFSTPAALDRANTVGVLASVDGLDVAVAQVDVFESMGYVGWVGTLPSFRRRGLGEIVTRAVTNAAFELGADIVVLEASPMGLPLYEKMGYETVAIDRVWVPPID
jgi:ribosomal protein S18 acetylase RimI-like enzyme